MTKLQFKKLQNAYSMNSHTRLIFEWVKTNVITLREFEDILEMIKEWETYST